MTILTSRLRIIAANVGQRADNGQLSGAVLFVLLVEMTMASEKSFANLWIDSIFCFLVYHCVCCHSICAIIIPSPWSWMEGDRNWPSCQWRDLWSGRVSEHLRPAGRVRWAGDCEVRRENEATMSRRVALTNGYHLLPRPLRISPN